MLELLRHYGLETARLFNVAGYNRHSVDFDGPLSIAMRIPRASRRRFQQMHTRLCILCPVLGAHTHALVTKLAALKRICGRVWDWIPIVLSSLGLHVK